MPYLSNTKELGGVAQTPVTKFMTQNRDNFFRLTLLNQSVVDDNVLLPGQSKEVGVAVSTALATVDDIQFLQGEFQLAGEVLDASLESTGLQRRQLVEQRQNRNGIDRNCKDLDENTKQPEVVEERVTGFLDNFEHGTDNRGSQDNAQHLTLEHVRQPELQRLLVKPELLLENERAVVRDWQRQERADDIEPEDKHKRLDDFTLEPSRKIPRQQIATEGPELGEKITIDKR